MKIPSPSEPAPTLESPAHGEPRRFGPAWPAAAAMAFALVLAAGASPAPAQDSEDPTLVVGGGSCSGGPFASLTDIDSKVWNLYNEGVDAFNVGDLKKAEERFKKALDKDQRIAPAHLGLAEVHLKREEYGQALAQVDRFVPAFPSYGRAYEIRYAAAEATGDGDLMEEAKRSLRGTGTSQYMATLLYNEGVKLANAGNDEEALKLFEEAVVFQPDLVVALSALLDLAYDAENYPLSAVTAERLLTINARHRDALLKRFNSYLFQGDLEKTPEAARALAEANDAYNAPRLMRQGRELVRRGRATHGAAALTAALALDPELHEARFELGKAYAAFDPPEAAEAREHLEAYLSADPEGRKAAEAQELLAGFQG